jgi:hypothetical protein
VYGQAALIQRNKIKKRQILKLNHIEFEIRQHSSKEVILRGIILHLSTHDQHIRVLSSPKENKAKLMTEYSTV